MITHHQGICPLCERPFLRIELHAHILVESPSTRQDTIKEITARHPGWAYQHGACQSCWDSHRALSQSPQSATIIKSLGYKRLMGFPIVKAQVPEGNPSNVICWVKTA